MRRLRITHAFISLNAQLLCAVEARLQHRLDLLLFHRLGQGSIRQDAGARLEIGLHAGIPLRVIAVQRLQTLRRFRANDVLSQSPQLRHRSATLAPIIGDSGERLRYLRRIQIDAQRFGNDSLKVLSFCDF